MPQFHRNITLITDAKLVEQIKQQARKINRADGISHTEALETAVKELGYLHWHHFSESAKVTAKTEKAYRSGLIMAFDMKEAEDIEEVKDQGLVCDAQARYFCEPDLRKAIPDWREPEEDERTYKEAFPDHLDQIIDEVLDELVFFRFDGKRLPATLKEAVKLVLPWSFFSPSFVWLNGSYYQNISNVENDKGNVNCVRF